MELFSIKIRCTFQLVSTRHDRSHAKRQTVHRRRQSLEALLLLVDEAKPCSPLAARPVQKNIKQNNHENQTRIYPAPDRR